LVNLSKIDTTLDVVSSSTDFLFIPLHFHSTSELYAPNFLGSLLLTQMFEGLGSLVL